MSELMALTLHCPWGWAIMDMPAEIAKPLENRGWLPPAGMIGKRFAVHNGLKYEDESAKWLSDTFLGGQTLPFRAREYGIIGTVRLVGVVNQPVVGRPLKLVMGDWGGVNPTVAQRWFAEGSYGWLLDERQALPYPIPCKGFQKFWRVSNEVVLQMPREVRCA